MKFSIEKKNSGFDTIYLKKVDEVKLISALDKFYTKKELEKINRELLNGNQNQAYLMRGSNLNRRI